MNKQQYDEAKARTVKFEPAKDYESLLRQANALYMLVKSLEATKSHLSTTCDQLVREYAMQGQNEIDAHRKTNEILTEEVERLEGVISELYERDRWIPVSERLPETEESVLVTACYPNLDSEHVKLGHYQITHGTTYHGRDSKKPWQVEGNCETHLEEDDEGYFFVTHWKVKPLPAPPEGKDNEHI